jgi:hypothetical protein
MDYLGLTTIDARTAGFAQVCHRSIQSETDALMQLDAASGKTELLAKADFPVARFTWSAGADAGLVTDSSEICSKIGIATEEGVNPLQVLVGEGANRFSLGANLGGDSCRDGRADWPAWSPDGSRIALFASPDSEGRTGLDRLRSPWDLYISGSDFTKMEPALKDVLSPRGLIWSPDNTRLAFSGTRDGEPGTWIFDESSNQLTKVSSDDLAWLTWSPDGQRLAGLEEVESPEEALTRYKVVFVEA